eukprot:350434-Chlamydomonas_euryale.AAC.3
MPQELEPAPMLGQLRVGVAAGRSSSARLGTESSRALAAKLGRLLNGLTGARAAKAVTLAEAVYAALETAGGDHAAALKTVGGDHAAALETVGGDHAAALETVGGDHAAALETVGGDHAAALETVGGDHATALETVGGDHAAALEAVGGDHAAALETVGGDHAAAQVGTWPAAHHSTRRRRVRARVQTGITSTLAGASSRHHWLAGATGAPTHEQAPPALGGRSH